MQSLIQIRVTLFGFEDEAMYERGDIRKRIVHAALIKARGRKKLHAEGALLRHAPRSRRAELNFLPREG